MNVGTSYCESCNLILWKLQPHMSSLKTFDIKVTLSLKRLIVDWTNRSAITSCLKHSHVLVYIWNWYLMREWTLKRFLKRTVKHLVITYGAITCASNWLCVCKETREERIITHITQIREQVIQYLIHPPGSYTQCVLQYNNI